jgi:hypothetical protein
MKSDSLTGTWKLNVLVGDKSGVATFDFVHAEDGSLSGTYTGQVGSAAVTGTVRDNVVQFGFNWHGGKVKYDGVRSGDKLSGTCV